MSWRRSSLCTSVCLTWKAAKISVRDEYVERYLERYRHFLQLSPLPSPQEKTPLITTLKGRGGLSDRHVWSLLQAVFDRTLQRMQSEGWSEDEIDQLRSASLHRLLTSTAAKSSRHSRCDAMQAFERLRPRDKPILHSYQGWQVMRPSEKESSVSKNWSHNRAVEHIDKKI